MKRKIATILLSMILVTGFFGCSKSNQGGDSNSSTPPEQTDVNSDYEINLGYYNCDHMVAGPVGEAAGIYKAHNLKVKLTGNGKVPQAMAAGQMDAGYIGARGLVAANGEGSPIVYAANNHIGGSMYLVVSNDIKKPEDLYGQKVAMGDPSTSEDWLAGYSQILNLSTKAEDYELVNTGSDSDSFLALSTGQIKGYTCCDPWGSMAEHQKVGKIMATYRDMDDEMGICCGFALNKNFIKEHRELAVELLKAHQDSIKYIYEHPKKAAEIFSQYYNVPYEVSLMTIYKKCNEEGRTLTWQLNEKQFNHAYEVYKKYNLVKTLPPVEDVIERDIYNDAGLDDFDKYIQEKIEKDFPVGMTFEEFEKKANEIES
ncbi:MAG: ABC transporter substrate-binding subunit SaoX [Peptostreptococcaceae bacterium]|nr:ABC transporter substrate-binding subunit SaoX [Peptostreptococcaceae bacterium]